MPFTTRTASSLRSCFEGSGFTVFTSATEPSASTTNFTISPVSTNRWYQLLYTTDLTVPLESYTPTNLGKGATSGTFPVDGDWYGGLRVTPTAPTAP